MTEPTVIASRRAEAVAMWVGGYVALVIVQLVAAIARRAERYAQPSQRPRT